MISYNWEQKDWPTFTYSLQGLEKPMQQIVFNNGKYDGAYTVLPKNINADAILDLMVIEAIKTSEIEGEYYSKKDVLSSIKKKLGLHQKAYKVQNRNAENISNLMVAMRQDFNKPLSKAMLFNWYNQLFANTKQPIHVGKWRTHSEPMQVVSGAMGKAKVHFEAPPSTSLTNEMQAFITWFNLTAPNGTTPMADAVIRAALAHIYFLSIHPFEDGNGRIARALTEKVLAQHAGKPWLISLSYALEKKKKQYYAALQLAQQHNNVTAWVKYFIGTVLEAQKYTEQHITFVIQKNKMYEKYKTQINERQLKVLNKMLDQGVDGFEGGMNALKYIGITKASKATATRDLQELLALGIFTVIGAGRSTRYDLVMQ
jgi:Fic family protein